MIQPVYYDKKIHTGRSYNERIEEHGILQEKEGICYITFPALSRMKKVRHCFSTRMGGVSKGACASMNLADNCGDTQGNLRENYKRMAALLGITLENIVLSDQVHGVNIQKADASHGMGENLEKRLEKTDGLVTDADRVALATSYADCVPLLFAEEERGVIAGVHAGWRGTAGRIGQRAVEVMEKEYGCNREKIQVVIGPSICQECYEVSEDTAREFTDLVETIYKEKAERNRFYDLPEEKGREKAEKEKKEKEDILLEEKKEWLAEIIEKSEKKEGKYQLDLWMANRLILEHAGIPSHHITTACICTCCNSHLLHSHRATGGNRGGLRAFLMLDSSPQSIL